LNGLGGQHGEKSQIEDEVSSEEDGEEDEAPEEAEVDFRNFAATFDFEECRDCVTRAGDVEATSQRE
jgi:hypothetical protein